MEQQRIEEIDELERIGDSKVVYYRINGQHPEDWVLKPF